MKALIEKCTKKESMIVLFLCGVLIFVILLPTESNSDSSVDVEYEENQTNLSYKEMRESELKNFLESVSGVGEVSVLLYLGETKESVPPIEGVLVAAKGAREESVRLLIMKLVMALYGVEANMVEVTALVQ
jgi:hypothetical protein